MPWHKWWFWAFLGLFTFVVFALSAILIRRFSLDAKVPIVRGLALGSVSRPAPTAAAAGAGSAGLTVATPEQPIGSPTADAEG